ncbi:MAG: DNA-processing protein DprA, partial [Deltaproteobacteria bacterium]
MDESLVYWLGLTRIEGLGVRSAHKLINRFGSPHAAYMASLTELELAGLPAPVCQSIFAQAGLKDAEKEIEAAAKLGCQLYSYSDEVYPARLREIADPPLVLYVRGDVKALADISVGIVGTRKPSTYGLQVARR